MHPPVSEMDRASADQKWVRTVIWMSGPSFDEVFKVSTGLTSASLMKFSPSLITS